MRWWLLAFILARAVSVAGAAEPDPESKWGAMASAERSSYWGPIPAPGDSNTVEPDNPDTPTWEHLVNTPYYIVGLPFRLGNAAVHHTVTRMDEWGLFDLPPVPEKGLPLPVGFLLMPEIGYSSLSGFKYGVNIRHPHFFGEGNKAYLAATSSTRHSDRLGGGFHFPLDDNWALDLGGGGSDIPLARYFGTGSDSRADDESYYNRISRWAGFDLARKIGERDHVRLRTFYSHLEARPSQYRRDQALDLIHADDLPAGFPHKGGGLTAQMDWAHDTAGVDGRPDHGAFKRLAFAFHHATDGSALDYFQYTFDWQQFVPLWHTKRVLGLRFFGTRILPDGDAPLPLARMVNTYRPYSLRGLESHRYHGLGSLGLSAEYRWPIWVVKGRAETGVDAFIFLDTGQIYDQTDEINREDFAVTYGFGLRMLGSEDNFAARLVVGFGDDDMQIQVGFSQSFQHFGKGMMHGKDPTRRP